MDNAEATKDDKTASVTAVGCETPCYVAITSEQHPHTGEAMPILKKVTRDTTVGELIDWYKKQ